jgi:chaperonin GroEL (HSP60 family)
MRDVSGAKIQSKLSSSDLRTSLGKIKTIREELISGRRLVLLFTQSLYSHYQSSCIRVEGYSNKTSPRITLVLFCKYKHIAKELESISEKSISILYSILSSPVFVPGAAVTELHLARFIRNRITNYYENRSDVFNGLSDRVSNHLHPFVLSIIECFEELIFRISTKSNELSRDALLEQLYQFNSDSLQLLDSDLRYISYHNVTLYKWSNSDQTVEPVMNITVNNRTVNVKQFSIIDSLSAKKFAILSALEAASTILRVDGIVKMHQ